MAGVWDSEQSEVARHAMTYPVIKIDPGHACAMEIKRLGGSAGGCERDRTDEFCNLFIL